MSSPNIAVVVIHMQNDFLNLVKKDKGEKLLEAQEGLFQACSENDLPIYLVEMVDRDTSISYGATISQTEKAAKESSRYEKFKLSGGNVFVNGNIEQRAKQQSVDTICLTGVWGSYCVKQSAKGAQDCGFNVITSNDLIANPHYKGRDFPWFETMGLLREYDVILDLIRK